MSTIIIIKSTMIIVSIIIVTVNNMLGIFIMIMVNMAVIFKLWHHYKTDLLTYQALALIPF